MAGSKRRPARVLITRAAEDAQTLAQAVREAGGTPLCLPAVRTGDWPLKGPLQMTTGPLERFEAVGFGSRRGVQRLAQLLREEALGVPEAAALFAVGPSTAQSVLELLGRPGRVGLPHTALGMAALMAASLPPGAQVLLPTAAGAGGPLQEALFGAGLRPMLLPLYETVAICPPPEAVTAARAVDYIVFTSPSCVRSWALWGLNPSSAKLLTMGPSTSRAVTALGLAVAGEAEPSSFAGLCALLKAMLCPSTPP